MKAYRLNKEDRDVVLGVMRPTGMPMTYSTTSKDVYFLLKDVFGVEPDEIETITDDVSRSWQYAERAYSHTKYYYTV